MSRDAWVLTTDTRRLAPMIAAVRGLGGTVTVAAVGPRALAEAAAAAGPDAVAWIEPSGGEPPESFAAAVAAAVVADGPRAVLAPTTREGRALLGAAAAALGAMVVAGVRSMAVEGDVVVVERADLGGRVEQSVATRGPVAGLFGGEDGPPPQSAPPAPIVRVAAAPADLRVERVAPAPGATGGVTTAERVVSVGRGLKAKADLAMVEDLAGALGAEIACSMPIADDFGWVAKDRYVGRSGQQISPRLYIALGISGMPQHLEGIRDAKTVVAVNSDPEARIFRRADYGIVGDIYEVVPALVAALGK